jgi:hypothetical protein
MDVDLPRFIVHLPEDDRWRYGTPDRRLSICDVDLEALRFWDWLKPRPRALRQRVSVRRPCLLPMGVAPPFRLAVPHLDLGDDVAIAGSTQGLSDLVQTLRHEGPLAECLPGQRLGS